MEAMEQLQMEGEGEGEAVEQLQRAVEAEKERLATLRRLMHAEGLLEPEREGGETDFSAAAAAAQSEGAGAAGARAERVYVRKDALVSRRKAREAGVSDTHLQQANTAMEHGDFRAAVRQLDAARRSVLETQERQFRRTAKRAQQAGVGSDVIREAEALSQRQDFARAAEQLDAARRAAGAASASLANAPSPAADRGRSGRASPTRQPIDAMAEGVPPPAAGEHGEKYAGSAAVRTVAGSPSSADSKAVPARYRLSSPYRAELLVGAWVQVTRKLDPAKLQVDNGDGSWQVEYADSGGTMTVKEKDMKPLTLEQRATVEGIQAEKAEEPAETVESSRKGEASPEMEEFCTLGFLARTMSADDVVSYMQRVGLEEWVVHFIKHLPANMKSITALRKTSVDDIRRMVRRALQAQPLPQELGVTVEDEAEAEQGTNESELRSSAVATSQTFSATRATGGGDDTGATTKETPVEKLRRERNERDATQLLNFLDANGLRDYQELFSGCKRVANLQRMTRESQVENAARRCKRFKQMTRAQHMQIAQAVQTGLAELQQSRGR